MYINTCGKWKILFYLFFIFFCIFQSHKLLKTHFDRMIYVLLLFRVLSAFPDVSRPSNIYADQDINFNPWGPKSSHTLARIQYTRPTTYFSRSELLLNKFFFRLSKVSFVRTRYIRRGVVPVGRGV